MNLMELFVKISVDDQASSNVNSITDKIGGGLKTAAGIGIKAITAASGAIIGLTGLAIKSYAEYEQLVGGVETLFGTSADTVMQYAENAYKTAGMSANEYMSTVTSFSASLLQSLDGDTEAAAKYADQAITDMSDNANKMGTDMELIQNAYQGFAKQNYTMLDNLKLGYGGTKEEMERLLADAEKLSGQEFDISNYADVVEAIHIVQTEMGITGTTAEEAAKTIEGSVAMTKAAWSNLVTGIADDNADFDLLIDNFIQSVSTAAGNILPRIETALMGVSKLIGELFPVIMEQLPTIIMNTLPQILASAGQILLALANGIINALPLLASTAMEILPTLVDGLLQNLPSMLSSFVDVATQVITMLAQGLADTLPTLIPQIVDAIMQLIVILTNPDVIVQLINAGIDIMLALINGIIQAIPLIIEQMPVIIMNIATALIQAAPQLIVAALQLIAMLIQGLAQGVGSLIRAGGDLVKKIVIGIANGISSAVTKAKELGKKIISAIKEKFGDILSVGGDLVKGLWNGINNKVDWIKEKLKGFKDKVMNALKDFFGIKSPSRVMRDEVGRYLAEGIVVGFNDVDPMKEIEKSLNMGVKGIVPTVSVNSAFGGGIASGGVSVVQNIYSQAKTAADLMQEALYQQKRAVYIGV